MQALRKSPRKSPNQRHSFENKENEPTAVNKKRRRSTPVKENKPRKSLNRRVSFATTAHIRLFEQDEQEWPPSPPVMKPRHVQDLSSEHASSDEERERDEEDDMDMTAPVGGIREYKVDELDALKQKREKALGEQGKDESRDEDAADKGEKVVGRGEVESDDEVALEERDATMDLTQVVGGIISTESGRSSNTIQEAVQAPEQQHSEFGQWADEDNTTTVVDMDVTQTSGGIIQAFPPNALEHTGTAAFRYEFTAEVTENNTNYTGNDTFTENVTYTDILTEVLPNVQPSHNTPNISMKDFLEMVGITFMEGQTFSKRRETIAKRNFEKRVTIVDFATCAAANLPQLELYQFCCQELSRYIDDGKVAVKITEEKASNENPRFFKEYMEGTQTLKDLHKQRFSVIKFHSWLSAKENWYDWRNKLVNDLNEGLRKNLEQLQQDEARLERYAKHMSIMLPEMQTYHAELKNRFMRAQDREKQLARCDTEQMKGLEAAIEEQKEQLTRFHKRADALNEKEQNLYAQLAELERRKADICDAMETAQAQVEASKCVTAKDLSYVKADLKRIEDMHNLKIRKLSPDALDFVLDGGIDIKIDLNKVKDTEEHQIAVKTLPNSQVEHAAFVDTLGDHAGHGSIPRMLFNMSIYWHKLKLLHDDVRQIRIKYPTVINTTPTDGGDKKSSSPFILSITSTLFHFDKECKLFVRVHVPNEQIKAWPNIQHCKIDTGIVYGQANQQAIDRIVRDTVRAGGYHVLQRVCDHLMSQL
ncbi:hypothetical protein BZG36_02996 [Bifiguratus adelaidae]|uniref:Spc7 kinetochore protein domain-containing protein n=1 Tax=Bifiguratus adelaidae TaxID=1938954 RepID=A0A261XYN3_9FUNG|nr:hypothetical protein BZG36_02996 [Bifiguratus adelaidae]